MTRIVFAQCMFFTGKESSEATQVECDTHILDFIVEYMNHHRGVPPKIPEKPLKTNNLEDAVDDKWDCTFIQKILESGKKNLYDLVLVCIS